eukprot:m.150788 g.150788  ORF g.150788 m.150788 type:complete len:319 (+) comp52808_c0_seq1:2-958(+)
MKSCIDSLSEVTEILLQPQVAHRNNCIVAPAKLTPRNSNVQQAFVVLVEQHNSNLASHQGLDPHLCARVVVDAMTGNAKRILVHRNNLLVRDNQLLLVIEIAQIGGNDERSRPQTPERELCPRVNEVQCRIEQRLKKVGIEPAIRLGVEPGIQISHVRDNVPSALSVAFAGSKIREVPERKMIHLNTEHLRHLSTPLDNILNAPLTQREQNRSAGGVDGLREVGVELELGVFRRLVAVVGLDKVDAPARKRVCILLIVTKRAGTTPLARESANAGVDANLEAKIVHVVCKSSHSVRKAFWIRLQVAIRVACLGAPAVI